MALHHRHKHRLLTTIVTLIAFTLSIDIFFFLQNTLTLEASLLLTFATGILFLTLYHLYTYEHCHERLTMINNLTQIYFGVVLLVSVVLISLLRLFFNIEIANSYIILSLIVLAAVFLSLGPYDRFLEEHIGKRFPMRTPSPKRRRK